MRLRVNDYPYDIFFNLRVLQIRFLRSLISQTCAMTLVGLTILMACQTSLSLEDPPHIYYGEDVCDQCGMIITEERYAAAYVTKDGTIRRFDDIGGMVLYDQEHSEEVLAYWVHDFISEEWVNAKNATYVINKETTTPMSYGIIAFKNAQNAASEALQQKGVVMNFVNLFASEITSGFHDGEIKHDDHEGIAKDEEHGEHQDHEGIAKDEEHGVGN